MLFKKTQSPRTGSPQPQDNARLEVAAHLRMADKYIREGKFAEAKDELDAVRSTEPNNVYALALEERRQAMEAAASKGQQQQQPLQNQPSQHTGRIAMSQEDISYELPFERETGLEPATSTLARLRSTN